MRLAALVVVLALVNAAPARAACYAWSWTATGDDSMLARADHYEMHRVDKWGSRSILPVYSRCWTTWQDPAPLLVPGEPGTRDTGYVTLQEDEQAYRLTLYVVDDWGNKSLASNSWVVLMRAADTLYVNISGTDSVEWVQQAKYNPVARLHEVHWPRAPADTSLAVGWPEIPPDVRWTGVAFAEYPRDPIMRLGTFQLLMRERLCRQFGYVAVGGLRCYTCCPPTAAAALASTAPALVATVTSKSRSREGAADAGAWRAESLAYEDTMRYMPRWADSLRELEAQGDSVLAYALTVSEARDQLPLRLGLAAAIAVLVGGGLLAREWRKKP